ncbi:MAG: CoA pyrophosphatase [Zoogloeaceae bacterium]|nr:CoA pyrophosphatase [Zoogloeaceae bacterium]
MDAAIPVAGDAGATDTDNLAPAAVLFPLVDRPEGCRVLLTRRTDHLRDHPGQISFPGGRMEPGDASPRHAALREAGEEIGLVPDNVEILGELPPYATVTGFRIHPVVARLVPPLHLCLDPFEVAEVFEAPLDFLLDPRNHHRESLFYQGKQREYLSMSYEGHYIWGATAGMIRYFAERFADGPEPRPETAR